MLQLQHFTGANDNSPNWPIKPAPDKVQLTPRRQVTADPIEDKAAHLTPFLWLVPIAAFVLGALAWWMRIPSSQLVWPSIGMGLALILTATLTGHVYKIRNLSVLAATGAFATGLVSAASQVGISLYSTDLIVTVAALSIALAWVFQSRPALMLSLFSGLIWLASLHPSISATLNLGQPTTQGWLALFPILVVIQGALATHFRDYGALALTIAVSYIFLASLGTTLPFNAMVGLLFASSAAHHRMGKAWADVDVFGARLHITMGWIAAIGAGLYLQSVWMNLETGQAASLWTPHQGWWLAFGIAAFILFISSLLRYKQSQITLAGIFLVSAAALVLPVTSVRPDLVYLAFDTVSGLTARPGFGFVIGACIMASGVAWIVNGIRKEDILEMVLGAITVGLQILILFKQNWMNLDSLIMFSLSLVCALCVSGLIAGASLNHARPPRRYA